MGTELIFHNKFETTAYSLNLKNIQKKKNRIISFVQWSLHFLIIQKMKIMVQVHTKCTTIIMSTPIKKKYLNSTIAQAQQKCKKVIGFDSWGFWEQLLLALKAHTHTQKNETVCYMNIANLILCFYLSIVSQMEFSCKTFKYWFSTGWNERKVVQNYCTNSVLMFLWFWTYKGEKEYQSSLSW